MSIPIRLLTFVFTFGISSFSTSPPTADSAPDARSDVTGPYIIIKELLSQNISAINYRGIK